MKRRLVKVLKILLLALVLLLVAGIGFGYWKIRRSWPQTEGKVELAGLSAPVEVVRDRWGVPHLFAQNERDLFFAQGYVHAQDRLWQMHFNRVVGSGKLSTLFGAGPLPADRYLRTVGLRRSAEKDFAILSPDTRAILQSYTDGVNAFLTTHAGSLPIEFSLLGKPDPWTPVDSLAWSRAMSLNLSLNAILELTRWQLTGKLGQAAADRLIPPYPKEGPFIVPFPAPGSNLAGKMPALPGTGYDDERSRIAALLPSLVSADRIWGSNAWVVHGSRTATGKPLLANDTHLGLGTPSVWYEIGLHGGRYDTVGFSMPGLPCVILGQNKRIAWGVTNLDADVQDLYVEKLDDPKSPKRAQFQGRWEDLRVLTEKIPVKGGEPQTLTVLATRHGPLVHKVLPDWKDPRPLAMRWAASEGSRLLDGIAAVSRAQNWQEFHGALSHWDTPSLNFVYADVDGNIGYQSTAKVPLRPASSPGRIPVPGWTGSFEWQGFIDYEEMPRVMNPEAGFVVTANNKVVSDDYPHLLTTDWPYPERAQRITELLAADRDVTLDDMQTFQADTFSAVARELRPALLRARPSNDVERQAMEQVRSWDLRFEKDATGAPVFRAWLYFLLPNTFKDELGDELYKSAEPLLSAQTALLFDLIGNPGGANDPWFDDRRTPAVETREDIVQRSFKDAVAWLSERLGDDPAEWQWGTLHRTPLAHTPLGAGGIAPLDWIFNAGDFPLAGDGSTVNSMGGDPEQDFRVGFGVSQRFIADLSDLSRSIAVNSTGQAALPFHPHRADQARMWAAGEYHPVLATREAARAEAEAVLTLAPGSPSNDDE